MKKLVLETSFRDLLGHTDSLRRQRASTVRVASLPVSTDDSDKETWNFSYKSDPSTTGQRWNGYIKFVKEDLDTKKSADDQPIHAFCSCPDFHYRWKHSAVTHGLLDKDQDPGAAPITNPRNKMSGCKHLVALSKYLQTKLQEMKENYYGDMSFDEQLNTLVSRRDLVLEFNEDNDMLNEQQENQSPEELMADLASVSHCNFTDSLLIHLLNEKLPACEIYLKGSLVRIEYTNFVCYVQINGEDENDYSVILTDNGRTKELAKYDNVSQDDLLFLLQSWYELDADPEFNEAVIKYKGEAADGRRLDEDINRVCMHCGTHMGMKKSEHTGDSHGICPSCWDIHHSDFGPYPEEKPKDKPPETDKTDEGFDPQSQAGPNVDSTEGTSKYNPYPEMLSKMKKTERGEDEELNAVFDELMNEDVEDEEINLSELLAKLKNEEVTGNVGGETDIKNADNLQTNEEGPHGRYAQESGAGVFDPRTFGDLNPKEELPEMYLTQPTYKRKGKLKEEGPNFGKKYTKHPKQPVKTSETAGAPAPPAMGQGSGDSLAMDDKEGHFDTEPPMSAVNVSTLATEEDVQEVLSVLREKKKKPSLHETIRKVGRILGY